MQAAFVIMSYSTSGSPVFSVFISSVDMMYSMTERLL